MRTSLTPSQEQDLVFTVEELTAEVDTLIQEIGSLYEEIELKDAKIEALQKAVLLASKK